MIVTLLGLMWGTSQAAGDKNKYPEFSNNVKGIDTIESARSAKSFYFNNNAGF